MMPDDYLALLDANPCYWCGQPSDQEFMCRGVMHFACAEHLPTKEQLEDINA